LLLLFLPIGQGRIKREARAPFSDKRAAKRRPSGSSSQNVNWLHHSNGPRRVDQQSRKSIELRTRGVDSTWLEPPSIAMSLPRALTNKNFIAKRVSELKQGQENCRTMSKHANFACLRAPHLHFI
jgi:hypothetical protein